MIKRYLTSLVYGLSIGLFCSFSAMATVCFLPDGNCGGVNYGYKDGSGSTCTYKTRAEANRKKGECEEVQKQGFCFYLACSMSKSDCDKAAENAPNHDKCCVPCGNCWKVDDCSIPDIPTCKGAGYETEQTCKNQNLGFEPNGKFDKNGTACGKCKNGTPPRPCSYWNTLSQTYMTEAACRKQGGIFHPGDDKDSDNNICGTCDPEPETCTPKDCSEYTYTTLSDLSNTASYEQCDNGCGTTTYRCKSGYTYSNGKCVSVPVTPVCNKGEYSSKTACETNHPDTICTQNSSTKCWIGKCDTKNNKYYYESKEACYEGYQDECYDCNYQPCEQVDEDSNCWFISCEKIGFYNRESDCQSKSPTGNCTFDAGLGCYMPDEVTCDNNKELYDTQRECEKPLPSNVNGGPYRSCVYDATTKCYKPKNSSCSDRDLYESEFYCGQNLQGCKPVTMNGITCYMPNDCEDLGYFNSLSACTSKNPSGCIKIEYWEDNLYCYKPKTSSCEIKGGFDDLATCVTNYGKEHCQYDATTKCYIWKSATYTVKVEGICSNNESTFYYDYEKCTASISPSNVTSVRAILSIWHAANDWDSTNNHQCEKQSVGGGIITSSGYKWSDESHGVQFANEICWTEGWYITMESFTINGKTVSCPGSITLDNGDTYKCETHQDSGGTQGCC